MEPNAYRKPPPSSFPTANNTSIDLRAPLPIYPPPNLLLQPLPSLPSPQRKPAFSVPWTLSTHLFPAAYLRTTCPVPEPDVAPGDLPKEERRQRLLETRMRLHELRTESTTTTTPDGYPRVLWNCVNRYVRVDETKGGVGGGGGGRTGPTKVGLTLFFVHANGFPKETFEPTLGYLLSSPAASLIDEVWVWESVQHGDAALINASHVSGLFDWQDNARDIINFLLHFLPSRNTKGTLPTHLPRLAPAETEARVNSGFSDRRLVAVGHSYGGCTSVLAAAFYPSLFTSLILVDPVIANPNDKQPRDFTRDLAFGALSRRDTWPSRAAALESFTASPFFQAWDPAVLKIYTECGLYDAPAVTKLKTSGMQEAVVFAETHAHYEAYARLASLDARISLRWVMPGKPGAPELGGPGSTKDKVWVRPENATNTRIYGGGHLIPQEAPREFAQDLSRYLMHHQFLSPRLPRASL